MSGFASHFFFVFFQQLLCIAAVAAVVMIWASRHASKRQRPIRVPVQSRRVRVQPDRDSDGYTDNSVDVRHANRVRRDPSRISDSSGRDLRL